MSGLIARGAGFMLCLAANACAHISWVDPKPASAAATALPLAASMPLGEALAPPQAFLDFCATAPDQCAPALAPRTLRLTDKSWALLTRVQASVNAGIVYTDDRPAPGRSDDWSLPLRQAAIGPVQGDCEDYALEKRRLLRDAGVPAEALAMTVAVLPDGEWHAVLVVTTDRGDFVLDNRIAAVVAWDMLNYRWVMRESADAGTGWRAAQDGPELLAQALAAQAQ
jgi:predicted transglutaminase-like cysteine proteinase